ncbi:MAG: AAA family ATPase [Chloroflexota bacterium]
MATSLSRPAIAILLPGPERDPVALELARGGFDPIPLDDVRDLAALLAARGDVATAVLDAEADPEQAGTAWAMLHQGTLNIPALMVVSGATLDRLDTSGPGHEDDEYLTRPYSAESIRWRIEAMCIRSAAVDDGSGPVLQSTISTGDWGRRGQLVAVFNPKGGVGKTTVSTNLAAMLVSKGQRVLLVDADTVTGHVPISLGMDAVPTVVDAWRDELDGGPILSFIEMASDHSSGLRVLPLSSSPIHTEILDADRVAASIAAARRNVDWVITDLHPSYSPLNRAVFDKADRILVPVTPDLPAIRAAIKLRDVADELGMRDRLAMVVNRANSGVSVADIEKAVGIPAYAQIRSAGQTMVKATNEGRTLVEMAPKDAITTDFAVLADRLLGRETQVAKAAFRLFGRQASVRA